MQAGDAPGHPPIAPGHPPNAPEHPRNGPGPPHTAPAPPRNARGHPHNAPGHPRNASGFLHNPALPPPSPSHLAPHRAGNTFPLSRPNLLPMRDMLRRRLTMLRATLQLFDQHPDLWSPKPALARNVAAVRLGTAELDAAARDQDAGNPTGLTRDKREARDLAEELLGALGATAGAYAIESGDDDFATAVDISRADWDRMPDADFFTRADNALARIEADLDKLDDYEVTRDDVTAARDAVDAARPLGPARDTRRAGRVSATAALDGGYSDVVPPLRVLDRLVPRLINDPGFVADYAVVRRIPGD